MQKEINSIINKGLEFLNSDSVFESNCELTAKCYKIIFSFELLIQYTELLELKVGHNATYLDKLVLLKKTINSKLRRRELRTMKSKRNSLAHDTYSIVLLFTHTSEEEISLDEVLNNISIMIKECEEFRKSVSKDTEESTRTKIPTIEKSNIF